MRYLIKNVKIVTPEKISQRKDILIENGIIKQISKGIDDSKATLIESKNLHASIGFCDVGTYIGEPGFEEKETIVSLAKAAAHGGYTAIAPFPNLNPVVDNKSTLKFLHQAFQPTHLEVFPIGAISKNCQGKDISEMLDMNQNGAIAFSDGRKSIQDTGLVLRALQYTKGIKKLIIQQANEKTLSQGTEMHEGKTSTALGMSGNPVESEVLMAKRDIDLANYAEAPICLYNISSAETIELVKKNNKKNEQNIYCSVASMNLIHIDEELENFNTFLKVHPPLRSSNDRKALIKAVNENQIDFITSNHQPVDLENKDLEFNRSAFGASTIDTVFSSLLKFAGTEIELTQLIKKLAYGSREVLGLKVPTILEGSLANLVLFDPSSTWTVKPSNILSKSKNNPYIGQDLLGTVIAVFNKNLVILQ